MKALYLVSLSLIASFTFTGCSSAESPQNSEPQVSKNLTKVEVCREAFRLLGKTTDEFQENLSSFTYNFNGLSSEFSLLASKTADKNLAGSLNVFSDSLIKMSQESTFFEGNSMYLNELTVLSKECS